MNKVLVTGGCGYIGSHTIVDLLDHGFEVVSVDSLINADLSALDGIEKITGKRVRNHQVDLKDLEATKKVFEEEGPLVGIIHFAALKSVEESTREPMLYFNNNMCSLFNLLDCVQQYKVPHFIFSSSCTVYGTAEDLPVTEDTPFGKAECPYGRTKQMGEHVLEDVTASDKDLNVILLRYFNPAGAHESAWIGESPRNKATNLVPVITETAIGKRESMTVFGGDYDTRDGSCIRDYIHVMDLAHAHTLSLQYLLDNKQTANCEVFNLGIGEGATVLEAINAFEKQSGQKLNYQVGPRRAGDIPAIYSNYNRIHHAIGWSPQRDINDIMHTAWEWEKKRSE